MTTSGSTQTLQKPSTVRPQPGRKSGNFEGQRRKWTTKDNTMQEATMPANVKQLAQQHNSSTNRLIKNSSGLATGLNE